MMGWPGERQRHSMSSRGVRTARDQFPSNKNIQILFHVTFKRLVPAILKGGIKPQRASTYTGQVGEIKEQARVYGFTSYDDAVRWASKMQYDFQEPTSVIVFTGDVSKFERDRHFQLAGGKGKAVKKKGVVKSGAIIEVVDVTPEMTRRVVQTLGEKDELKYQPARGTVQNKQPTIVMGVSEINTQFRELPMGIGSQIQVTEIMDAIQRGKKIPPILVSKSGFLQDGRHKLEAYKRLGYNEVPVVIGHHPSAIVLPKEES